MHVTLVQVRVKPEHVADFIEASRANHQASLREPGNLNNNNKQNTTNPTHNNKNEAYRSADAAAAHKETAHYLAWRERVAPWMAEPRVGVRYLGLCPAAM